MLWDLLIKLFHQILQYHIILLARPCEYVHKYNTLIQGIISHKSASGCSDKRPLRVGGLEELCDVGSAHSLRGATMPTLKRHCASPSGIQHIQLTSELIILC